jgi:HKD family nuclease
VVEVAALRGRTRSFHPKSWLFESESFGIAFVGSSNLSRSALDTGIEWNLRLDRDRDAEAYARVRQHSSAATIGSKWHVRCDDDRLLGERLRG